MNKILTIAKREYLAMVATKTFLVTLIMMPILMFGGIVLMPALSKIGGGQERRIKIVDGTGKLAKSIQQMAEARNAAIQQAKKPIESADAKSADSTPASAGENQREAMAMNDLYLVEVASQAELTDQDRLQWSDDIRNGKIYAFVEIPANATNADGTPVMIRFVSQDAMLSEARGWLAGSLDALIRNDRLVALGLDAGLMQRATSPVQVEPTSLYEPVAPKADGTEGTAKTESKQFNLTTLFLPFGMMMLMFLVIFLAAQPMLESAMEEKSQRIAEVLLGAVSPTHLMAGKLFGNVGASFLVFTLYGIGGYVLLYQRGMHDMVPLSIIPWFVIFQILGVLFYSSIFMAIGASVRELKEAQSLLLPVWMFLMAPMMVWFVALRDPLGPISVAMSLFPPSAPLMNILRMGTGTTIPIWQPIAATILLAATTAVVIWVAGRVYRASLLRGDSAKSFSQIFARITASTR